MIASKNSGKETPSKIRRRENSKMHQQEFREMQKREGRKTAVIFIEPEFYSWTEEARDQLNFPNIRETVYHFFKLGIQQHRDKS
jgi:hypothetical protein